MENCASAVADVAAGSTCAAQGQEWLGGCRMVLVLCDLTIIIETSRKLLCLGCEPGQVLNISLVLLRLICRRLLLEFLCGRSLQPESEARALRLGLFGGGFSSCVVNLLILESQWSSFCVLDPPNGALSFLGLADDLPVLWRDNTTRPDLVSIVRDGSLCYHLVSISSQC